MALIAIQNTMEDNNEVNGSGEPGSHCCILFLELIALQGYTPIVVIPIHRTERCLSIKSLLTGLLWIALACSFLVSAEAQTPRHARVNGHLTLPTGVIRFPEIITITLTTTSGQFLEEKTLQSESNFSFIRVPYGEYYVVVESSGYETTRTLIELDGPSQEVMILVRLGDPIPPKPGEDLQPRTGAATVGVTALSISPKALKEYQNGEKEAKKGKPDKAILHFTKVLEESPDYYPAHEAMGMQYAAQQKWEEAIQSLEKAIEIHPENPTGRRNLAQCYLSQGRFDSAVEQLNAAAVMEPNNSKTLMLLGESYLGLRECPAALDYFLAASDINQEDHSYLGIGQCYLQAGRLSEALVEFETFLKKNPKDPRAESVRQFIPKLKQELESNP